MAIVEREPVPSGPVDEPDDLTAGELKYWRKWSPLALANGMLTPSTSAGFVLLCQQAERAEVMWATIQSRGLEQLKVTIDGAGQEQAEYKANSLLTHWRALMLRCEQLQARYGLAADGKGPARESERDTEATELARLLAVK